MPGLQPLQWPNLTHHKNRQLCLRIPNNQMYTITFPWNSAWLQELCVRSAPSAHFYQKFVQCRYHVIIKTQRITGCSAIGCCTNKVGMSEIVNFGH